jgi:hypothetical protein
MPLLDLFWSRVEEAVQATPGGRKSVQRALKRVGEVGKNKNTHTTWFSEKEKHRRKRPDLQISGLEQLAAALGIPPAELLTEREPSRARPPEPRQLELPFRAGSHSTTIEIECTGEAVIFRPAALADSATQST